MSACGHLVGTVVAPYMHSGHPTCITVSTQCTLYVPLHAHMGVYSVPYRTYTGPLCTHCAPSDTYSGYPCTLQWTHSVHCRYLMYSHWVHVRTTVGTTGTQYHPLGAHAVPVVLPVYHCIHAMHPLVPLLGTVCVPHAPTVVPGTTLVHTTYHL